MSSKVGAAYDEACFHLHDGLQALVKRAQLQQNENVLDLGCGTGTLAIMASRLTDGLVYGVDFKKEQIEYAKTKIGEDDEERIFFLQGNINTMTHEGQTVRLPRTQKFDVLFATGVMTAGTVDMPAMLRNVRPFMKPDARLVLDWSVHDSEDAPSCGAVIFSWETQETLAKLQWINDELADDVVDQMEEATREYGLQVLRPIRMAMGDGEYLDVNAQLPTMIMENMAMLVKLWDDDAAITPPASMDMLKPQIELLKELQRSIQQGESVNVGDFLRRFVAPKRPRGAKDRRMMTGMKWQVTILPVYQAAIHLLRCMHGSAPHWDINDTQGCAKDYCASGVFTFPTRN